MQIAVYLQVSSYLQPDMDKISGSMKLVTSISTTTTFCEFEPITSTITATTCCEFEPATSVITVILCNNLVTTGYPCSKTDTNFISYNY